MVKTAEEAFEVIRKSIEGETPETKPKDILIFDIETDGVNPKKANMKWFGCYSYNSKQYTMLDFKNKEYIRSMIKSHKILIGFNNKNFDQEILKRYLDDKDIFKYKVVVDLYQISAPRTKDSWSFGNKSRLAQAGIKLENYKLKTICEYLNLDDFGKGDIDYDIFQKEIWDEKEIVEIEKYLKQDLVLTKKLYEWYEMQFECLAPMMKQKDAEKLNYIKSTSASLGYQIICHQAGLEADWESKRPNHLRSYEGGHHINPKESFVKGNIVEIDFSSAYPHSLIMGNLYSKNPKGWNGNNYYKVKGKYDEKKLGKVETALRDIMIQRLEAKRKGDKIKSQALKLVINSIYGATGDYKFKSLYDLTTAGDCTSIVRTWLKKLAKHLHENGFGILYGFTDSIFVKIPNESNKKELMFLVDKIIEEFKSNIPFPQESFKMGIDEEIKMFWIPSTNCYLFVTQDNKIKYKDTLLNKNTPEVVMNVFENYMKPKIIKDLEINFTENEIIKELKSLIKSDINLASEKHNVGELKTYNVKTSMQYQISEKYGAGQHFLIANTKGIGAGKSTKVCSIEDFEKNNLTIEDVDFKKILSHLKPFFKKEEKNRKLK